ncbi:MAG: hypothetical protein CMM91_04175 [Rickettsiales bacterium]|nr:hypothetical protein [Rickettsiales bacterium]OUV54241.1 MAG: hypothetical protein CBC87_02920 [Rickettsiales bacterium TMED127]|tara:strand:+ start:23909 stop:25177 length:1269 start_codon:yes stop_codon:yes gene_type:complete
MDASIGLLVGSIIGLIVLSGFFSGSETSLTAASKARLRTLAKSGNKNAALYEKLLKQKETLICTILLANNLVNVLASALATTLLVKIFENEGILYVTVIMTLMILLFGELLPKTIALFKADIIALKISPIFNFLTFIFYPITRALNFLVVILIKIFGIKTLEKNITDTQAESEEELRGAIELHSENTKEKNEKEMLKSILDLDDVTVGSIMIPRKNIYSFPVNISYEDLLSRVKSTPHSRIPVWDKNPENIIGVFHVRSLIEEKIDKNFSIKNVCIKPWFIPESASLANQLMEFKKKKEHFAIVVDEYGEFLGIVTLEDILEEIVGDIDDELDVQKIRKKIKGVKQKSLNKFDIQGTVSIRDLNRELGWSLPDKNASTIAGLVLHESRTIPNIGQIFQFYGFKFEVLGKKNNQITLLKISKI